MLYIHIYIYIYTHTHTHTHTHISEKAMGPDSSTPAWKIPWTEESGRLSPWGREELDTTE